MQLLNNPYFKLLRVNHWFKNLFIFFGVQSALWLTKPEITSAVILKIVGAFFLASFISSVNYIINQITDRDFDKKHPLKKSRPIPSGKISIKLALAISLVLFLISLFLADKLYSYNFLVLIFCFWIAGVIYNVKPIRLKDLPYVDVLSESANNPIRFLIGWFVMIPNNFPPFSVLLFAWSAGAVLMTAKRYDELFYHGKDLVPYRKTFATYTLSSLKRLLIVYSLASFILFSLLVYTYQPKLIFVLPLAFGYLVWLLSAILSGRAKARNVEHFVLTRGFLVRTSLLFVVIFFLCV